MQAIVVALVSLLFTSLTLTAVMSVAWRCFGRPRHALIWSAMFATRSLEWSVNLAGRLRWEMGWHWYLPIVDLLGIVSAGLLAAGFGARAGANPRLLIPLAAAGAGAVILSALGAAAQNNALSHTPIFGFSALAFAISARHVWRKDLASNPAEALAFAMLLIVVAYTVAGAIFAVSLPPQEPLAEFKGFRLLLLLGLPASSILIGSACIFLIASDLAQQMRTLALSDSLTGIFNRRGLERAAEPLIAICRRQNQPVAVVVADLDRFKQVNDRFGHAAGDALLKAFASYAHDTLRGGDLLGRIGGEEFALVLPNTNAEQAGGAMERLRMGMAAIAPAELAPLTLSASFGVAMLGAGDRHLDDALARADRALYAAKAEGRDRVIVAAHPVPAAPATETVFG